MGDGIGSRERDGAKHVSGRTDGYVTMPAGRLLSGKR